MTDTVKEKDKSKTSKGEKSQALKNKCLHERRRRDLENAYFEELAELISASITDMSSFSVKPEKCAILQESLQQIKQLKQEQDQGSSEAVQQSQVSSSKPARLANDVLGPLLLEALDGFLFVVNSQGKIDFVSENITQYLKYTQDELIGKSVYNIIHVGDHAQFSSSLLPMSLSSVIQWPTDSGVAKGRSFNCRMLIKPPCEEVDDVEVKQTCVSQYENMHISSVSQPGEKFSATSENSEGQSCLVCIARRLSFSEETNTMLGIEQFTTKQDTNGKIVAHDISGIIPRHHPCPELNGQNIHDFCHVNDAQTLYRHFQEVLKSGCNTSGVYRFKLQENLYVYVQTRSKHFQNANNGETDFVMSTHSIIRECDSDVELKGSASTSLMKAIVAQSTLAGNQRSQNVLTLPNSMAILNAVNQPQAFMPTTGGPAGLLGVRNEDLGDNIDFNQSNWDSLLGDIGLGNNNNSGNGSGLTVVHSNGNLNMSGGIVTSSTSNLWDMSQQLKSSAQQQQLMRNVMNMQQNATNANIASNFPRNNSFDGGGGGGQKSPGIPQSPGMRGSSFQMPTSQPSMRSMGYSGQRSPGSAGIPQNRMSPANAVYPSQRTPPSSGNLNQAGSWRGLQHPQREFSVPSSPVTTDPLAALQNIGGNISQSPRLNSSDFSFPVSRGSGVEKPSKLSQLLAGNPSSTGSDIFQSPSVESVESKDWSNDNMVIKSPADSMHQSPTPGPGQSPPEKPQSTTNIEENDCSKSKGGNDDNKNVILKKLLSSEEDNEAAPTESRPETEDISTEMNEAEAKKPPNHLLKQLLSDNKRAAKEKSKGAAEKGQRPELLSILLNEDEAAGCTSAPAESTSQEIDPLSRSRNPSGQQEPQSSTHPTSTSQPTSHPLPTSYSSPSPMADHKISLDLDQAKKSTTGTSKNQQMSNLGDRQQMSNLGDRQLENILQALWEKDSDLGSHAPKRRKLSGDVDSTERPEIDVLNTGQQLQLKDTTRQKNVLLAQLLAKQTPTEPVVNTRLTVNPCEMPQNKLPQNLQERMLRLQPLNIKNLGERNDEKVASKINSMQGLGLSNSNPNIPNSSKDNISVNSIGSAHLNQTLNTEDNVNMNSGMNFMQQQQQPNLMSNNNLTAFNNGNSSIQNLLGPINEGEMDMGDQASSDQALLNKILEQAADLQRDISSGNIVSTPMSVSNMSQNTGILSTQGGGGMSEDAQLLSQFEQVISEANLSINDIESLITNNPSSQQGQHVVEDRAAIEAIQKQLMSEEPIVTTPSMMDSQGMQQGGMSMARMPPQGPVRQNSFSGISGQGLSQMTGGMDVPLPPPQMSPHGGHPKPAPSPQGFNQAALPFSPQGPRPAGPPGSLASALQSRQQQQQQRPVFPTSAIQVRQSLLQQQKLKQLREVEKQRLAQQQERQRQMMQRQLSQQFSQRFPQSMESSQLPPFPENLAELMNSGNAPNVTLQRNQIPGPMSPRFGPGIQQQQHPNLSQLIGPNPPPPASPISPHFNQQPKQWNMRNQQGMQSPMGIPPKSNQYNINRHRSLSGGTVTSGNQNSQFQFPEQFGSTSGNGQMNMYNQQQSMYQNRIMRQMSLPPGRGSPRTPASPFGNSPDPLLMSPHSSISPNSSMRNPQSSQISPPYNQASMTSSNYGVPGSIAGISNQTAMSQASSGGQGYQDFDMQLADLEKSGIGMGGNTTSQYVKQEIRNICSARSDQKQLQTQQSMPQSGGQSMSQSMSQSMPQSGGQSLSQSAGQSLSQTMPQSGGQSMSQSLSQSMNSVQYSVAQSLQQQSMVQSSPALQTQSSTYDFDDSSEIPSDIIEDIHQMEKEHQTHASFDINNFKEDDILKVKRQEAKHIYEQFRALANREKEITTTTAATAPMTENPEIKASTLFRNQLTTQREGSQSSATPNLLQRLTSVEKQQVQVVAKEPRNMVEDIKPPDHKNSLLQQLLSE